MADTAGYGRSGGAHWASSAVPITHSYRLIYQWVTLPAWHYCEVLAPWDVGTSRGIDLLCYGSGGHVGFALHVAVIVLGDLPLIDDKTDGPA